MIDKYNLDLKNHEKKKESISIYNELRLIILIYADPNKCIQSN
jgi:hypothetical protein